MRHPRWRARWRAPYMALVGDPPPSFDRQIIFFYTMQGFQGTTRTVIYGFCLSHIFATLLIDGQGVFPVVPEPLPKVLAFYCTTLEDPLMSTMPLWFRSLLWVEMIFELPFFFCALHYLSQPVYPAWFQGYCIAYGAATATTLVPILAALVHADHSSLAVKALNVSIYLPYLAIPIWIMTLAWQQLSCNNNDNDKPNYKTN